MTGNPGASVRQRRVSAEMRALREERGLTCQQVANALGCSTAKISRMETGVRGLYPDDVAAILGYLQAPAEQRGEFLADVRAKCRWPVSGCAGACGADSAPPGGSGQPGAGP